MAVSDLEAKIRSDAFRDVPNRIQALTARLDEHQQQESTGQGQHDGFDREMHYLEKVVSALPRRHPSRSHYLDQLEALRNRVAPKDQPQAKRNSNSQRKTVGDFLAECASPAMEQLRDPSKLRSLKSQRSGLGKALGKDSLKNLKDPGSYGSRGSSHGSHTSRSKPTSWGHSAVANFLMPDLPAGEGDDAVNLLAVNGKLTPVLGRCQTVMCPEQDKTLLIRAWIEDDNQQEQVAYMELSKGAAQLHELAAEVAQTVQDGQEGINDVASHTEKSKEATKQAVSTVTAAAKAKFWLCNLIGPLLGVLIILCGWLYCKVSSHTPPGGVVFFVVVGVVLGGIVFFVSRKFINWRARTMKALETDMQHVDAAKPLPAQVAAEIRAAGLAAQARLSELVGGASWSKDCSARGMEVESGCSSSGEQLGLHAFKIQFAAGVSAGAAFDELERLRIEGKLDPKCKAMWSRPVDSDGTHVRKTSHSFILKNREFLTVCRSSKAQSADPSLETYVCAMASLSDELTHMVEPDKPKRLVHRGLVHLLGVSVRDVAEHSCQVDVVVDMDPQLFACTGISASFSDRASRHRVLNIATQLSGLLEVKAGGSTAGMSTSLRITDD